MFTIHILLLKRYSAISFSILAYPFLSYDICGGKLPDVGGDDKIGAHGGSQVVGMVGSKELGCGCPAGFLHLMAVCYVHTYHDMISITVSIEIKIRFCNIGLQPHMRSFA
jgi:hypothetical protein